jgi:hypothetical protein
MTKSVLKYTVLGLAALALTGLPLRAQNAPAVTNSPAAAPKKASKKVLPFHGALKAVDNVQKTITVGTETIQITSETKISKAGKPAELEDGAVGDMVAGAYRKDAEGKLNCVVLRFAPKVETDNSSKTNAP